MALSRQNIKNHLKYCRQLRVDVLGVILALGGIYRVFCRGPKGMFLSKAGSSEHTASCQSSSEASVAQGNSTKPAMMRSSAGGKESSPKPSAVFFFPLVKAKRGSEKGRGVGITWGKPFHFPLNLISPPVT